MPRHAFVDAVRAMARSGGNMFNVTVGEVTEYDPKTHSAKFALPLFRDSKGPIETGFVPCATPYAGNDEGAVFPIQTGSQALLLFIDPKGMLPLAALFLFNDVDVPPYTDGKTYGWKDKYANFVTTLEDENGKHRARLSGADNAAVIAPIVELGQEGLKLNTKDSTDQGIVRFKDFLPVVNLLNDLIGKYNAHTHNNQVPAPNTHREPNTATCKSSTTTGAQD